MAWTLRTKRSQKSRWSRSVRLKARFINSPRSGTQKQAVPGKGIKKNRQKERSKQNTSLANYVYRGSTAQWHKGTNIWQQDKGRHKGQGMRWFGVKRQLGKHNQGSGSAVTKNVILVNNYWTKIDIIMNPVANPMFSWSRNLNIYMK